MSDNGSEDGSDVTSSDEEESISRNTSKLEIDSNDMKLTQMRRGAQKRGGQGKISSRFEVQ